MKKNYNLWILLFVLVICFFQGHTQESTVAKAITTPSSIEGLTIFPNPITNGKVFINSKWNLKKDIEIFDVLGKKIISTSLLRRELDVAKLTPGVYILKVSENNKTATRKLVVR